MQDDPWKEKNNKVRVITKLPTSPADEYFQPSINKVLTKIKVDHEDFTPRYQENSACADLFANIPNDSIFIVSNGSATIDCGICMEVSSGYKICASTKGRGLMLNSIDFLSNRIKLNVTNLCKEKLIVRNKDKIGEIWIEPIYFFEWDYSLS